MSVVAVESKGRVTIPAGLRKRMGLREGDVMEAALVADGILRRRRRAPPVDFRARALRPRTRGAPRRRSWRTSSRT